MHSPFSFFIFVMRTLLCCFDPRNISDTFELFKDSFNVLLSLHSFFFSDAFFYACAQVLQSLFLFFGHASPLLDESQDFSIFIKASPRVLYVAGAPLSPRNTQKSQRSLRNPKSPRNSETTKQRDVSIARNARVHPLVALRALEPFAGMKAMTRTMSTRATRSNEKMISLKTHKIIQTHSRHLIGVNNQVAVKLGTAMV